MTIFRQNIITVMPLFIILGVLYCLVSRSLQLNEFHWSVDQEAQAIGAVIHEFVTNDFDLYFSENRDGTLSVTDQFKKVLYRLRLQNDSPDITIFDREMNLLYFNGVSDTLLSHTLLASSGPDRLDRPDSLTTGNSVIRSSFVNSVESGFEELENRSADTEPAYVYELDLESVEPVLHIYSRLFDSRADSVTNNNEVTSASSAATFNDAFITVSKNAASYAAIHAEIIRWTYIEFMASFIAGLMVSLVLTFVLRRSVKEILVKSVDIISGRNGNQEADSRIYEFNELGNTMKMLVNVLGKNMESYRKHIIENEQMRTPLEIASTFKTLSNPEFNGVRFNRTIRYGFINSQAPNYFISHLDLPDRMLVVSGYREDSTSVDAALDSDAISRILLRKVIGKNIECSTGNDNGSSKDSDTTSVGITGTDSAGNTAGTSVREIAVGKAARNIQELFPANNLKLDFIQILKSGEVSIDRYKGLEAEQINYPEDHDKPVVIGYFPDELSHRINNYCQLLHRADTGELFDDIEILSKGYETGVLIIISPQINDSIYEK